MSKVSNKELGQRYECGELLSSRLKKRVEQQLKRVCKARDCENSIAFTQDRTEFCSRSCSAKEKYRVKAANKAKKKRYYERHGITRKTVKRSGTPARTTDYLDPSKAVLVYENYKEPLKEIPRNEGFGYYGTVASSDDGEYIQCHICGLLFRTLGGHVRLHKLSARSYREKFKLGLSTVLVSPKQSEKLQEKAVKRWDGKSIPEHLARYNAAGQPNAKGGKKWSLEHRNKLGLCPDQVLVKIRELADKLGHTPSEDEFRAEYKGRYLQSIRVQHNGYLEAVAKLGLKSAKEVKEHTDEELLEALVQFKEKYGRIPMTADFNRGGLLPSRNTYFHRFGTLNDARIQAGLNAVLPLPFGQIVEMTPDEYIAYKQGRQVAGIKDPNQYKRRKWRKIMKGAIHA